MRRIVRLTCVVLVALLAMPMLMASEAGAAPGVPTLESPSPGFVTAVNPPLSWTPDPAADQYNVQISTTDFGAAIVDVTTYNANYVHPSELPTGILYWRVRAHDSSGWSSFSASRSFQKTDRDVPVPLDPPNGDVLDYPQDPVVVIWQETAGASSYNVQIDDEPTFTSPMLQNSNSDNDGATIDPALAMGTTIYWRVRALYPGGAASQFSPIWTFSVAWDEVPQLVSPPDQFDPAISRVNIKWTPTLGAVTYDLQVSPNIDFTNNTLNASNLKSTSYNPTATLANGSYFWRVRAKHIWGGFGAWSQTYRFTKAWPAPGDALSSITLLTPANGDFDVKEPNFSWTPTTRAAQYEIWVGDDENFSPGTYDACKTDHTRLTPFSGCGINVSPGIVYFWRVRGIDQPKGVLGVWSSTFSFMYSHGAVNMNAPADNASTPNPVLKWDIVDGIGEYKVTVLKAGGTVADSATVFNNTYVPTGLKLADGPFSWYVQTVDGDGNISPAPAPISWRHFSMTLPAATFLAPDPTSAPGVSGFYGPLLTWQPVTNATKYQVWMRKQGSVTWVKKGDSLTLPAFAYPDDDLATGTWEWYAQAYQGNVALAAGTPSTFVIADLQQTTLVSPTHCANPVSCPVIYDTPTLNWSAVPGASHYLVSIATDVNFTNVIKSYTSWHTQMTPTTSLVDSQANQALYWYARPCYGIHCGPEASTFAGSPSSPVFAFKKQSAPVVLTAPGAAVTVTTDQITFDWQDFLATNQALNPKEDQEAERYRIQVSSQPDFSSNVFSNDLSDETTYTDPDDLYPDGPIYWRVQARDNTGNYLTFSEPGSDSKPGVLYKHTPPPTLLSPAAGASVAQLPEFQWTSEPFASSYDIEIYKNVDQPLSSGNRVYSDNVGTPGAFADNDFEPGVYGWRVRKRDTSGNLLPWSAADNTQLRLFTMVPRKAELLSPANDSNLPNNDILLSWLPVGGASQYRVQVSTSPSFANFLSNDVTITTTWAPKQNVPDGDYYWRVLSLDGSGNTIGTSDAWLFHSPGSTPGVKYTPMPPVRIQDSRPTGPQVGPYGTRWSAGTTRDVQVANANGIPADAEAVTLNVTVTNSTAASFLTLFPAGETRPLASNLNWASGQTIANSVTVKVGTAGKISVYNPTGLVDVIIDAVGYYRGSSGAGFTSLPPTRIQDSRPSGPQVGPYNSPWGPGTDRLITVAGTGGVPADAEAVVVNTTVTNASASSFLTVYPAGATRPLASSLNWFPGMTIANAVTVKVGTGGQIRAYSPTGSVDVIMDVVGYFKTGSGDQFHALSPARIQDSRSGSKVGAYNTPWAAGNDRTVSVTGVGGVPTNAKAVMLNATVTNTSAASFLTIYPAGTTRPLASSLNWSAGWTIPNAVTAKVGTSGQIRAYNPSGTVDVIMDVNGWYG